MIILQTTIQQSSETFEGKEHEAILSCEEEAGSHFYSVYSPTSSFNGVYRIESIKEAEGIYRDACNRLMIN